MSACCSVGRLWEPVTLAIQFYCKQGKSTLMLLVHASDLDTR